MKKFGFGRKEKSEKDDGDSNRSGLFGRKKPTSSQDENPYAQQPAEDPYARITPYSQAKPTPAVGPRGTPAGLPSGPSPSNVYGKPPPYSEQAQEKSGYQPQRYGASGGYGSNRYDVGPSTSGANRAGLSPAPSFGGGRVPARGPGGYGGLGPAEDDHNKDELLSGATGKYVGQGTAAPSQTSEGPGYGLSGTEKKTGDNNSWGGYGEPHEMTEEELQQQEYRDIKKKIQGIRDDTASSTDRSVQLLDSMLDTASGTAMRLKEQGEMLHNTNRNLDMAASQSRVANEKIDELKTLNRSMFAIRVGNPLTKSKREQESLDSHMRIYQAEKLQAEQSGSVKYKDNQHWDTHVRNTNRLGSRGPIAPKVNPERSKYMLEDDSDEEGKAEAEMAEAKIDANLDRMAHGMRVLKSIAVEQGELASRQNDLIDEIGQKSDTVNDRLEIGKYRMAKIR
ncbi:Meiosis-specific subunit of the t-SNARE complex [Coniochaeta pulveracea]|uniref:Meiosis-specific subunit of the t-SNARE complex n=1 Tax=Coniochaeta pulveracea TaxID=177199 RepID=A0A420YDY3_9PEZI|nr:Meiosis-specific subunit of the t-SNARE complex [Coniochaeta pulveracea]